MRARKIPYHEPRHPVALTSLYVLIAGMLLLLCAWATDANGLLRKYSPARTVPAQVPAPSPEPKLAVEQREMWVTAYTSCPEETDDDPFTTASMTQARDSVVATNQLAFGTKVRIPEAFGDKVFVVEDRMPKRKKNNLDVWMPEKRQAMNFGIQKLLVEIVG